MIKEAFKPLYNDGFIIESEKTSLIFFHRNKQFILKYGWEDHQLIVFNRK
jgi:hypothetical protein